MRALVLAWVLLLAAPAVAGAAFSPPGWWHQAAKLLVERGGECDPFSSTSSFSYQRPGERATRYTVVQRGNTCRHLIPSAVARAFRSNPARPAEACAWSSTSGGPGGSRGDAQCLIYPHNLGTEAHPNLVTWRCQRAVSYGPDPAAWIAAPPEDRPVFRRRRTRSLSSCLAPRALLHGGSRLRVTCSHRCTITARSGRARTRRRLAAGSTGTVRLRARGSRRLVVTIRAAGKRRRVTGRVAGGTFRVRRTVQLR